MTLCALGAFVGKKALQEQPHGFCSVAQSPGSRMGLVPHGHPKDPERLPGTWQGKQLEQLERPSNSQQQHFQHCECLPA